MTGQRRAARKDRPSPSTLSGGWHGDTPELDPQGARTVRMRRLRSLVYRLGAFWFNALVTLFAVTASVTIVLLANALFPPPPSMVAFTIGLGAFVPLVVAPMVAWFIVRLVFEAEDARRIAERLAVTDPLTQAFNRRHFFRVGQHEFAQMNGGKQALSVLLLDIDNFKAVNDQHGHAVGDQVLKEVAQTCMRGMRAHDLLARFGGEEFVVLLPATDMVEAATLAERVRQAVELLAIETEHGAVIRPTVSIGVATTTRVAATAALSLDSLLAHADRAMYAAKRGGRNRVIAEPSTA